MSDHGKTLARMALRVDRLIEEFGDCLDAFEGDPTFASDSLASHLKCLTMREQHRDAVDLLGDEAFFRQLHRTLASWDMNSRRAWLLNVDEMQASFQAQAERIRHVQRLTLVDLAESDAGAVADLLWDIIEELRVGGQKAKAVAGTKALHHVLPLLIPPMDRRYTFAFLYPKTHYDSRGERAAFREMFPLFRRIATACRGEIESRLNQYVWHTSVPKVVDNAIIGYVGKHPRFEADS